MNTTTSTRRSEELDEPALGFWKAAWRAINEKDRNLYCGGPVRATNIHICPVCMHGCSFADITDFIHEANYWLECSTCGVEWNMAEEPNEVLDRLMLSACELRGCEVEAQGLGSQAPCICVKPE